MWSGFILKSLSLSYDSLMNDNILSPIEIYLWSHYDNNVNCYKYLNPLPFTFSTHTFSHVILFKHERQAINYTLQYKFLEVQAANNFQLKRKGSISDVLMFLYYGT